MSDSEEPDEIKLQRRKLSPKCSWSLDSGSANGLLPTVRCWLIARHWISLAIYVILDYLTTAAAPSLCST